MAGGIMPCAGALCRQRGDAATSPGTRQRGGVMRAGDATDAAGAADLTRLIQGYQFTQTLYAAARLGLPDRCCRVVR